MGFSRSQPPLGKRPNSEKIAGFNQSPVPMIYISFATLYRPLAKRPNLTGPAEIRYPRRIVSMDFPRLKRPYENGRISQNSRKIAGINPPRAPMT